MYINIKQYLVATKRFHSTNCSLANRWIAYTGIRHIQSRFIKIFLQCYDILVYRTSVLECVFYRTGVRGTGVRVRGLPQAPRCAGLVIHP